MKKPAYKTLKELGISPIPWRFNEHVCRDKSGRLLVDRNYTSIGIANDMSDDSPIRDEPNARLMAAAPELYDALRRLITWTGYLKTTEIENDPVKFQQYLDAEKALCKAIADGKKALRKASCADPRKIPAPKAIAKSK